MTAKQIIKAENPVLKIAIAVAQWAVIAVLGWFVLSAQTIASDSRRGADAFEKINVVQQRMDSVCIKVERVELNQKAINIGIQKDVEYLKQSVDNISIKLDKLLLK